MKTQNLRAIAAVVINMVSDGHSLTETLHTILSKNVLPDRDRAFVQALCYGVCRFYPRLDFVLSQLLKKPMRGKDSDIHALLMVGLFQLMEMRVPPHAAVAETVAAVASFKKPWAKNLVNAVLREYLREQEKLTQAIAGDDEAQYVHPAWWIKAIQKAWPNDWQNILAANSAQPPFALRVNARQFTRENYLATLKKHNLSAAPIAHTTSGIVLDQAVSTQALPAFSTGGVSVQDGAAQIAAALLNLQPGQRVLDACAAPGGKLTHILELEPRLSACVAVEKDAERMKLIKENLQRLGMSATCICADMLDLKSWWDGRLFDRILLDAPCSASGVVRRHPDIKLLRQQEDLPAFAKTQSSLLDVAFQLLKPSGVLVYVTCSIFPVENTQVVEQFLATHSDADEIVLPDTWGIKCEVGRQILPGMDGMDGFYYAKLTKKS